ncbi:hypothetical protein MACH15_16180 [Maricaulis maris]|nr:hypothetical protein MACH15_16180 [Maricaulis maris]
MSRNIEKGSDQTPIGDIGRPNLAVHHLLARRFEFAHEALPDWALSGYGLALIYPGIAQRGKHDTACASNCPAVRRTSDLY